MKINIFQIDGEKDEHGVMYQNLDALEGFQGTKDIQSEIYDKVFDGEVDCNTLEGVYTMFNTDQPLGYVGRSLSVSDIVQVWDGGEEEVGFYFCDSFGFKKVAFDPTKTVDKSRENFIAYLMEQLGYRLERRGKDMRIIPNNGKQKPRRLRSLGEGYTEQDIEYRIKAQWYNPQAYKVFLMRYPLWSRQIDCGAG